MTKVKDTPTAADISVRTTVYPPAEREQEAPPRRQIRRSVRRLDSRAKVDGTAEYIYNLRLPGMLYGKIFRSSVAHGRIVNIDASAALAVEGVEAVFTGKDVCTIIPDPYHGPAFHDQPILALEKVRHIGEPVAVVVAKDPHIAEEAAELIVADYDPLDAVFNEVEAARPGAPVIHEVLRPAGFFADLKYLKDRRGTNVALKSHIRHGDVEKGFASADRIFEHTFHTGKVTHLPFEPMVAVAEPTGIDTITIHTSTQSPSFVRAELSRLLGWPENRVRVRTAFVGGGFGAKLYIKLEGLAAVCALLLRKPVRIALTTEEQFYTITRHSATVRMKTGVKNDGRMVARAAEVWWNGGAYADIGPRVSQKSGFTAAGPYDIENVKLDNYAVYTNEPPAGALRGFGIPQLVWAYESQSDIIAHELGFDPLEFRRRNLLRDGRPHATGTIMYNAQLDAVLDRLAERLDWKRPFEHGSGTIRRGRGIAVGLKASISPTTSVAMVNICGDGSCTLYCSTVDMGQASDTAMAQIVAEVLGIEPESLRVIHPDTDTTPSDMATLGSRSTFHMGNAVRFAAEHVREQIISVAAASLGAEPEELQLENGKVTARNAKEMTLREIMIARFGMQAGNIIGIGSYTPNYTKPDPQTGQSANVTPFWMVGGTGVEIEVDMETGHIRVTKLVNAGDVGCAINPETIKRQLNGAGLMQFGFTLFEQMLLDNGQVVNASLADCKIPGFLDMPDEVTAEFIEVPHERGPFGAKGMGETGTFAVSPAIANALYDAVGVRILEMPLTPEKVLRAIRAKEQKPLGDE